MILAGDVGGTKVDLSLYNFKDGKLSIERQQKYPANEFGSLQDVVKAFLATEDNVIKVEHEVVAACFGCPGPVKDGHLKLTNLPWELDSRDLSKILNIEHIFLINDLEANGYGIAELEPDQIFELEQGDKSALGHRALVSAGTGLGEALLIWNSLAQRHLPLASEGGHADFAPRTPIEIELLEWLTAKLGGHVSYERVVSGIGLKNIYEFLRDQKKMEEPSWLRDRMEAEDPNFVIGSTGEDGSSERAGDFLWRVRCGVRQPGTEGARDRGRLPGRRYCTQDPEDPAGWSISQGVPGQGPVIPCAGMRAGARDPGRAMRAHWCGSLC